MSQPSILIDPYILFGGRVFEREYIFANTVAFDYTCHFGGKRVFLIEHIINQYLVMRVNIISPKFF